MPSTLGWIDYDAGHQESMRRVLAFFRERESRDELGLGAIRDAIADKLYPGTSTLQTRLRYMLFVPWIYRRLEDQRAASDEVARKARKQELALIEPLLAHEPTGVIGRIARGNLKTLPSSIYWAGLSSWGVLQYPGSQSDYHRAFNRLCERRSTSRHREDRDVPDELALTWHAAIPEPPDDFPDQATFDLTRDEASYLRDRLREEHPDSLLSHLAQERWPVPDVTYVWEHPRLASFRPEHRELIHHVRVFAEIMHGAAILYNLDLARTRKDAELAEEYLSALMDWRAQTGAQLDTVRALDLNRFWALVHSDQHRVSAQTRSFVTRWFELAKSAATHDFDSEPTQRLIRARESSLKGAQSRFHNRVALSQWSGRSGMLMMNYRWQVAASFLQDFHLALGHGAG